MKIIVISASEKRENEAQLITKLFENGLETLHLRKTKFSTRALSQLISEIPPQFHNRIITHTHHRLARKFNLKGVHIGKSHRKRKFKTWLTLKLVELKNPGFIKTRSFNKISSLFEEEVKYEYVFLSPIFDSLTSKYQSGFTEHSLRSALEKTKFNVIARGGIDITSIAKAKNLGFKGVALYSAIWKKQDPVAEFVRTLEKCKELGIKPE